MDQNRTEFDVDSIIKLLPIVLAAIPQLKSSKNGSDGAGNSNLAKLSAFMPALTAMIPSLTAILRAKGAESNLELMDQLQTILPSLVKNVGTGEGAIDTNQLIAKLDEILPRILDELKATDA